MRSRFTSAFIVLTLFGAVAAFAAGCLDRDLKPLHPCTISGFVDKIRVTTVDKVDLLFMVDNSGSMTEEQASLAREFPRLVQTLASGDRTGDGPTPDDFPPVRSLQIGVVTSDMGTGGFMVATCGEPNFGDDGVLRSTGNTAITGCMATYTPAFLAFTPGGAETPAQYAAKVACVASVGTRGCGFEQQLEAILKAVTPSTAATTFNMGTPGHADRANAGFVRPDSLLAIILVSDEEDCSALDPSLFDRMSPTYSSAILNLRCFTFPSALYPVSRYVDGLLATRQAPDLLVFAAIVGVPVDLVRMADAIDYNAILADTRMQEQVDTADPTRLRTSCSAAGVGDAFPPRRIVQVAQGIQAAGSNGIVQSICQNDYGPALDAIINKIADQLGGTCLPRQLNPDEMGQVACDVVEVLPVAGDFTRCDLIPGRTRIGEESQADGLHEICRVEQLTAGGVAPTAPGWYYDNFTTDVLMRCASATSTPQRIAFTAMNEPKTGTLVRLECLQPVQNPGGNIDVGTPCGAGTPAGDCTVIPGLVCDTILRECQRNCTTDAECGEGLRCTSSRVGPPRAGGEICVNPTCD